MKRFIALLCALAMVFSFALGAEASELDFLGKEYKSYEASMELSFKLNKPLDFIGDIVKQEEMTFDLQRFVESLLNAKYTVNMTGEMLDDSLKGKVYMEIAADQPIEFSDDLKIGVGVKTRIWMDYDFSSAENMFYTMIITNPLDGKYYVFDLMTAEDIAEQKQAFADTVKALDMEDSSKEMAALIKSVIEGNAKITKTGNTVTIAVSGDSVGEYICDMITGYMQTDYYKKVSGNNAEIGALDAAVLRETINSADIFGDDAITSTYTLDNNGYISESVENVHFDFNIYDLVKKFADPDTDISPITKENSDIDLAIGVKCTYSKINSAKVQMPVLTEENSVNIDLTNDEDVYEDNEEYHNSIDWDKLGERYYKWLDDVELKDVNNPDAGIYLSLNEFFDIAPNNYDNISGDIVIEASGAVTVNCSGRDFESKVIKGQLGSCDYTIDGAAYKSVLPLKVDEETGTIYADAKVLQEAFGLEVYSVEFSYEEDENGQWHKEACSAETARPNPKYDPTYDPWGDME